MKTKCPQSAPISSATSMRMFGKTNTQGPPKTQSVLAQRTKVVRTGKGPANDLPTTTKHKSCKGGPNAKHHYVMTTTNRQRKGTKKKNGKVRQNIQVMRSTVGFTVTDIAQGCIAARLKKNYKIFRYRPGMFPQRSRNYHMMAHWLREIKVTSYAGGTATTSHGKEIPKTRRMSSVKDSAGVVGTLNCKMGFLQSKDGHVLAVYHNKKASASCKRIKTTIAEAFESYYFQNGLRQYHTMGRSGGKMEKQRVTVKTHAGELRRVFRKSARSARSSLVGPGKHKGRKALKVGRGTTCAATITTSRAS